MKRLLTLTICTLLLLCSCGGNSTTTPVPTPETEETTLPAPETTADTTVVTTTAIVTTTTTTEITTAEETTAESIPENICYQCSLSVKSEEVNGKKLYSIEGLADSEMAAQVDEFIDGAFAELDNCIEQDNETELHPVVRCNVVNGYLSVLCGYTDGSMPEMGAISTMNYCRTAVFDIVEGRKIEAFEELFPNDFDFGWFIIPEYYTTDTYIGGIYEYPFPEFLNVYTLVLEPRDFSDYVTEKMEKGTLPLFYTSMGQPGNVDICSTYIVCSRFLSDEEIEAKKRIYETVESAMYEHYNNNRTEIEKQVGDFVSIYVEEFDLYQDTYYIVGIGAFNMGTISRVFKADGSLVYMRDIFPEFADSEAVVSRIFDRNDGSTEVWYSSDEFTYDCHKKEIAK